MLCDRPRLEVWHESCTWELPCHYVAYSSGIEGCALTHYQVKNASTTNRSSATEINLNNG